MNKPGTSVDLAVEHLQQGRIVAFPTETYYGLAVDPANDFAVSKLFKLKQRPIDKPLLLLVENYQQLFSLTSYVPDQFQVLIGKYWPGPLTLIFPALSSLNPQITAGTKTVGIRISPHPVAHELVSKCGHAITATSANISGRDPAKTASEVFEMFGDSIDYVLDGGETTAGLCSTIVRMNDSQLEVVRAGEIDIFAG